MKEDRLFYNACPTCRKKVLDDLAGYRCENCNKALTSCNPTYTITAKISDFSGSIYVSFISEMGEVIMNGMSATEFKEFKECNGDGVKEWLMQNVEFKVRLIFNRTVFRVTPFC